MLSPFEREIQKAEFETAGFTDFDAKYKAYWDSINGGPVIYFSVPPVCTAYWDCQSWLRHIDWTLTANAKALEVARNESH